MKRYVIVGNGPAGLAGAIAIRQNDPDGIITMLADEPHPTYFRAGLSEWFHGTIDEHELWVRPPHFYVRNDIQTIHRRATGIDVRDQTIAVEGREDLPWDKLLIATGASPWIPPWPGRDLDGIFVYRTKEDCAAIKARVQAEPDKPVAIIGGGILGMEFAYDCKGLGVQPVMIVRGDVMGSPMFDHGSGEQLLKRMRDDGVIAHMDEEVERFEGEKGRVTRVITNKGRTIQVSAVVVATGVRANIGFLAGSKLMMNKWLEVDATLQTSHPDIYGAGDCCTVWDPIVGGYQPTRTWEPSYRCGLVAGANMAGGDERFIPCNQMNASLAYDLRYVLLGDFIVPEGDDIEVLVCPRTQNEGRYAYRKLILKNGKLIGGTFLVDRRQYLVYHRLIESQCNVAMHKERLFDRTFDLNKLLPEGGSDYYFF